MRNLQAELFKERAERAELIAQKRFVNLDALARVIHDDSVAVGMQSLAQYRMMLFRMISLMRDKEYALERSEIEIQVQKAGKQYEYNPNNPDW